MDKNSMLFTAEQVYKMAGTESELLSQNRSRKLRYFGHVTRIPHDNVEARMMTGLAEGVRNRGGPRICWIDNVIAWTCQRGSNVLHIT